MGELSAIAIAALEPLVGSMAASTCVRATALSIGKTAADLGKDDFQALEASIRRLLGPVAPETVIAQVVRNIEGGL